VNTNNVLISTKTNVVKPVYSITPFTLIDFPDKTACIVWLSGCNMRCSYCYNPDIVNGKGKLSYDEVLDFLRKRVNLLDGVVLSGGECTLHKSIIEFIRQIKALGMLVKIDTNGSNPEMLSTLIENKLIDYVSIDFKASAEKFEEITKSNFYSQFHESLSILKSSSTPFEVRTTVHADLLSPTDIKNMSNELNKVEYKGKYFLQEFVSNVITIGNLDNPESDFSDYENIDSPIPIEIR
jgi:pyruvate formate lyase activating enzyme